jgi:hypothetical protein
LCASLIEALAVGGSTVDLGSVRLGMLCHGSCGGIASREGLKTDLKCETFSYRVVPGGISLPVMGTTDREGCVYHRRQGA